MRLGQRGLFRGCRHDRGAILSAHVIALAVKGRGIVGMEKELEKVV